MNLFTPFPRIVRKKRDKYLLIMKLSYLFFFISVIQVTASTYSQEASLSLDLTDVQLKEAFKEIQTQSGYTMFYSNDELNDNNLISISVEQASIEDVMGHILIPFNMEYEVVGKYILIKPVPREVFNIRGKVTDREGLPLIGVNIQSKKHLIGTATDYNGDFALTLPDDAKRDTLIFTFIGYKTQFLPIEGRSIIDVVLKDESAILDEVVVVGYGTVKKADLTGSVATVKGKEFNIQPSSQSFDQMLGGQLAGVAVNQINSRPGSGSVVNIRGVASIRGANQPLYVVDGIPIIVGEEVPEEFAGGDINGRPKFYSENPLLAINPNDIESIDVLKDASAAAIYGSRAANGVILITTKKGKRNSQGQLNVNYTYSSQRPIKEYEFMNADQYKEYITQVAENTVTYGNPNNNTAAVILNDDRGGNFPIGVPYFGNSDTDFGDYMFRENTAGHTVNLSYRGGSQSTNYFVALNASDQQGVSVGNDFQNYGFRANLDTDLHDRITTGMNVSFSRSVSDIMGPAHLTYANVFRFQPTYDVYEEDGVTYTSITDNWGRKTYNPVALLEEENQNIGNYFTGLVYGELKLAEGLTLRSSYNSSVMNSKSRSYTPVLLSTGWVDLDLITSETINTTWANTLTFDKSLNDKHNINTVLGSSFENRILNQTGLGLFGFTSDDLNSIGAASDIQFRYEDKQVGRLNSYFVRANYNYDQRYYFTVTGRADGSTKFGPNNRWGFFPSAAVMWNISNEDFLAGNELISDLRLRTSLGRTGLANLPEFQFALAYQTLNDFGTQTYGGVPAILSNGIPNDDLGWETTDQFDVALEFGLMGDKFTGGVNYYQNMTRGLLMFSPVSPTTGTTTQVQNVADISNTGWEVQLGAKFKLGPVSWRSNFNIAFNTNVLEALNGGSFSQFGNPGTIQEGSELGVLYGYEVDGIFQDQEEIITLNAAAPNGVYQDPYGMEIGAYKWRDQNGDGQITTDDRIVLGSSQPDFFGGWNNTFGYKGFELTLNFNFVQGVQKVWSDLGNFVQGHGLDGNTIVGAIDDTWSESNPDATYEIPLFGSFRRYADERFSGVNDREVFDASYIRLKSLRFGYSLPGSVAKKMHLRSVQLHVTANNIWTRTEWPGLDPEVLTPGSPGNPITTLSSIYAWDAGPLTRTVSFGVNIGL